MKTLLFAAAGMLALMSAVPAGATVIIGTGSGVVQPDENLLFNNNPAPGSIINGITNQTASLVAIFGGETLVGNGGQARIEAGDGAISSLFSFDGTANQRLGFDLVNPNLAFNQAEFRVFVGQGTATELTVRAVDTQGDVFVQTFAIPSNGFFFLNAVDGQLINRFSFAANGSIQDVRQIRIGGVGSITQTAIPEPATWAMMITGFAGAGALIRRRRGLATT